MGDLDAADPALIPDIFWRDDPGWEATSKYLNVACCYDLLIDRSIRWLSVAVRPPAGLSSVFRRQLV